MTPQITQNAMSKGQSNQIKQLIESDATAFDATTLGFSKEEAQEIIKNGGLVQKDLSEARTAILKKYAIIDQRFGAALVEFDFTVPMDYDHDTWLDHVYRAKKKLKTTYYYNDDLNSKNFANATNKLVPGKTYRVKIYPILSTVTSDDCLNFLKRQAAVLVGGHGLLLTQSLHKEQFPEGKWTVSFDEKEALWKDAGGDHRVPRVSRRSGGYWWFGLGCFEDDWSAGYCLLCVCDLSA